MDVTLEEITAAVAGLGTLASLLIGFAKRFGGARFVLARKTFGKFARLVATVESKLS